MVKIGIILLLMVIQFALLNFITIWGVCETFTLKSHGNVFLVFLKFLMVVACAILCYHEIKCLGKRLEKSNNEHNCKCPNFNTEKKAHEICEVMRE